MEQSPEVLGSSGAQGVDDGKGAVPLDQPDFDEYPCCVGTVEHRHRIVLCEVANRDAKGVKYGGIGDTVAVSAL